MRRLIWVIILASAWMGLGGCERPLFPDNVGRTQYERYDRQRDRYVPSEQVNAYGGAEPALRARLTPYRP